MDLSTKNMLRNDIDKQNGGRNPSKGNALSRLMTFTELL